MIATAFYGWIWLGSWFAAIWLPHISFQLFLTGCLALTLGLISYKGEVNNDL